MSRADHSATTTLVRDPLAAALAGLRLRSPSTSFGADIDDTLGVLLADTSQPAKDAALRRWLGTSQPCVFGRVGARESAVPAIDLCWIDDADLDRGTTHVAALLQDARRRWKLRALTGRTSSLQVVVNSARLTYAEPSRELVDVFLLLVGLYLPEWAPAQPDTICLDGLPLRRPDGQVELFAASMTTFFPAAHGTAFHDHRAPAGLLLNLNAVGHYTWAMYDAGRHPTPEAALRRSHLTALRSVGNGGYGRADGRGSTWHTQGGRPCRRDAARGRRPGFVPDGAHEDRYGAAYHIDVTVSSGYADAATQPAPEPGDGWTIMLDYFATGALPDYHNPALMRGQPIPSERMWDAPWEPASRSPQEREF